MAVITMERKRYSIKVGNKEYSNNNPNRLVRRMGYRKLGYGVLSKASIFGVGLLGFGGGLEIAIGFGFAGPVGAAVAVAPAVVTEAGAYGLLKLSRYANRKSEIFNRAKIHAKGQSNPIYRRLQEDFRGKKFKE